MAVVKGEKGKLPYGIYSKKHNNLNNIFVFAWIALYIIFVMLVMESEHFWILVMIMAIIWFVVLLVVVTLINPLNKAIRRAMDKLEIKEALSDMFDIMKNNLHSQSRTLVQIHCVNLLIDYDLEKAKMLFNSIQKPNENSIKNIYYLVEMALLNTLGQYEEVKIKLEEFRMNFPKMIKQYESMKLALEIHSSTNEIENIQQKYPIDTKMKFLNVENATGLAKYYYTRGKKEEGEKFANFVKENGKNLERIYNEICEMYQ